MATQTDVRRIALSLPETEEAPNHFAFSVRNKGKLKAFVWVWLERLRPKKPRVPQPKVIAVRVASLVDKDLMLRLDPVKFFTEPHHKGYPAVLVRLPAINARELRSIITDAWRCQAPKGLEPAGNALHRGVDARASPDVRRPPRRKPVTRPRRPARGVQDHN